MRLLNKGAGKLEIPALNFYIGGNNIDCIPIPKPKRKPKHKREKNPQKEKYSRIIDPDAINKARKSYCEFCGINKSTIHYQVHHIVFRSQRYGHDIPENLICLCSGPGSNCCHERAHNRFMDGKPPIKAYELKTLKEVDK